ncbi:glycoside hydrolase superfamily [Haematococcus lacustris]
MARDILLLLVVAALAMTTHAASFVTRSGHQLRADGKPFYFLGANAYWLQDAAKYNDRRGEVDNFFKYCNKRGLTVIRMWGFNQGCPSSKGVYDPAQMAGYDYIINSAAQHNIRLIIALGNTWSAYRSPEDFFHIAGVDPTNKTLLDWYGSRALRDLYKDHIWNMVTRKNSINGREYRQDPTIMMWDVINEPRCPGCTQPWQQQVQLSFIKEMADWVEGIATQQLVAVGTEGYYMDPANVRYNPGAGAFCEGEDWVAMSRISSVDVTTAHIYDRQLEAVPPTWRSANFEDVLNFFLQSMSSHERMSRSVGKPYIMEEFNLIRPTYTPVQQAMLFQMVYDYLLWNAQQGGAFAGAMFWNAGTGSNVYDDGYNIYLDEPDVAPPAVIPTPSGGKPSTSSSSTAATPQPVRQAIVANTEGLDSFRMGSQREVCAQEQARSGWTPFWTEAWARTVDVNGYQQRTAGKRVIDIIGQTAPLLRKYSQ